MSRSGSTLSMVKSIVRCSYPLWVIGPWIRAPGANVPVNRAPNQVPNSCAFVSARHTRDRGAFKRTFLVMLSVFTPTAISNLLVAYRRSGSARHATQRLRDAERGRGGRNGSADSEQESGITLDHYPISVFG